MQKTFQEAELEFFEKASFDRNPLHRDDSYARRTQFGQKVVYGVYAALAGLGEWLAGRNVRLSRIKGEFKKPLLLDEIYDLNVTENEETTDIVFSGSGTVFLKLRVWQDSFVDAPFMRPDSPTFTPKMTADDAVQYGTDGRLNIPPSHYSSGWNETLVAPPTFRLRRDQLPFEQITALLWSTYFIGMEVPGRQALYSSFEFHFDSSAPPAHEFRLSALQVEIDRRFNRLTIQGSATGVRAFTLSGFERPRSVETPIAETQRIVGSGTSMAGKRVLITGGSRGFGAALCQAFALQGAQVFINFHQSHKEAEALAESIAGVGPRPVLVQGDASKPQVWESLKNEVQALDILIHNASPVIPSIRFKDQSTANFVSFVDRSLAMILEPCARMIPRMNAGGMVVLISSVFVKSPEPGFSHYIAAKSAAEAFMRTLAAEHGALRFLIFRAPRMLTDQTNTVMPSEGMASPIEVARTLLANLNQFTATTNLESF